MKIEQLRLIEPEKGGDPYNLRGVNLDRRLDAIDYEISLHETRDPIKGARIMLAIIVGFWSVVAALVFM